MINSKKEEIFMKSFKLAIVTLALFLVGCGTIGNETLSTEESYSELSSEDTEASSHVFVSYDEAFNATIDQYARLAYQQLSLDLGSPSTLVVTEGRYVYLDYTDNSGHWTVYYYLFTYTSEGVANQVALCMLSLIEGSSDQTVAVYVPTDEAMYEAVLETFNSLFEFSMTPEETSLYNLIYGENFDIRNGLLSGPIDHF